MRAQLVSEIEANRGVQHVSKTAGIILHAQSPMRITAALQRNQGFQQVSDTSRNVRCGTASTRPQNQRATRYSTMPVSRHTKRIRDIGAKAGSEENSSNP